MLTKCCTVNYGIPEGAPTSPMLSNLVLFKFDCDVGHYCISHDIRYTRYADDMTFSGDFDSVNELINFVEDSLKKLNLTLNKRKTKLIKNSYRQVVTGIVVNKKFNTPRSYRRALRRDCHRILSDHLIESVSSKIGTEANKEDVIRYLHSTLGKINFVLQINPDLKSFVRYKLHIYDLLQKVEADGLDVLK